MERVFNITRRYSLSLSLNNMSVCLRRYFFDVFGKVLIINNRQLNSIRAYILIISPTVKKSGINILISKLHARKVIIGFINATYCINIETQIE